MPSNFADVDATSANFADEDDTCTIFFKQNSRFIKIIFRKDKILYFFNIFSKINKKLIK